MVHEHNDPLSPLKPGDWDEIAANYPVLAQLANMHIATSIKTFTPLLDSSNITFTNWQQMAEAIGDNYADYDGFVILHGTDTMCYTASALSFMLVHLGKPVILTGSQLPLASPRSDALENLVTSLGIAAGIDPNDGSRVPLVPEVCVFFRGLLLRGNRSRKLSASAYSGFVSPNYPSLGTVGEHIKIDTAVVRAADEGDFYVNPNLVTDVVMMLDIFPGIDPNIIWRLAEPAGAQGKSLKALILKTYGSGNTPASLLPMITQVVDAGVLVVDVTQCPQGMVEIGLYEASAGLLEKGVISGLDMTPETALCKLMWAFGSDWSPDEVRRQMQINQVGEQSLDIFDVGYGDGSAAPLFNAQQAIPGDVHFDHLEAAVLRFQDVRPDSPSDSVSLRIYVNHPRIQVDTGAEGVIQYAGTCRKDFTSVNESGAGLFLDVTSAAKRFMKAGQPAKLSVVSETGPVRWARLTLSLYLRA
jgi:L-asparaginase